jgi:lysophospholipase L1-like esterase
LPGVIGTVLLAAALAAPTPAPVYVALGDSTGVGEGAPGGGYPKLLARALAGADRPVRLVNLCVSGARLDDLLARQLERGLAAGPALVTVGIGINDAVHGTDPDAFARALDGLAERLAASGATIVVVNVPELWRSPRAVGWVAQERLRERVERLDAALAALAARRGFALVDLRALGAAAYGDEGTLARDRFHPSDEGQRRWAEAILPAAVRALGGAAAAGGGGLPGPGGVR